MFKLIGQIAATLCRTITMIDHLAEAGECQTEIIKDTSVFDAKKKRAKLQADLLAYEAQLEAEPTIQSADLKKAA